MENQITTNKLLPVMDLLKESWEDYKKKVWVLAGIVLFGMLSIVVTLPFGLTAFIISFVPFKNHDYNISLILVDALLILIGLFFAIIIGAWSRASLFFGAKENNFSVSQSLKIGWEKFGSFFWVSLLTGLAAIGGFILLIIPGIIFSIWFSFSAYIFVSEGLKGTSALKRSKQLVQGYWWPVFGRILVIMLITMIISSFKFVGSLVNAFFTSPFIVVYFYHLYQDLKRVKS